MAGAPDRGVHRDPDSLGEPVLFEIYERLDSVDANARRLLRELAPPILGAIALLVLIQVPLVWSLIRGLQRGSNEREALLANAIGSSNRERRRVASYLHDGPVQDIAGVAFSLAPVADQARDRGELEEASVLVSAIDNLRHSVRDLRALLVDLHPPHLQAAGLEPALRDLMSPLDARGIATELPSPEASTSIRGRRNSSIGPHRRRCGTSSTTRRHRTRA